MTDKEILLEWAKTYGEDGSDVKASMYGEDLMIEFAKYYHTEQLKLSVVSSSLNNNESKDIKIRLYQNIRHDDGLDL